jgi:hypothetical protein
MTAPRIVTATVIDFNAARAARTARPFQGRLLKSAAAGMDPLMRKAVRLAVAEGCAAGTTTAEIVRRVRGRPRSMAALPAAAAAGFSFAIFEDLPTGDGTGEIARAIVRDQVRQKARAAL